MYLSKFLNKQKGLNTQISTNALFEKELVFFDIFKQYF